MDPLHITEFASDRYFEKLNQLKDAQAAGASSSHQQDGQVLERRPSAQGPFILPIRGSKSDIEEVVRKNEQKVKEKRGFLGFRSKKSASKVPTASGLDQVERRTSVADSTKQRYVSWLPWTVQVWV
jgi:hypothetical protein